MSTMSGMGGHGHVSRGVRGVWWDGGEWGAARGPSRGKSLKYIFFEKKS